MSPKPHAFLNTQYGNEERQRGRQGEQKILIHPTDARQRNIAGDVVLEIIVRRDGTVGDVKILRGLPSGLNDRAVQAVRQWRFAPARRLGAPVDVIVEVSVEFKLR